MKTTLPKPNVVNITTSKNLRCDYSRQIVEERTRYPALEESKGDPGMLYDAYRKVYSAILEEMSKIEKVGPISPKTSEDCKNTPPRITPYGDEYGLNLSGAEFEAMVRSISREDLRGDIPIAIAAFEELACYSPGTVLKFGGKAEQTISMAGNNSQFFRGLARFIERVYYNTGVLYCKDQKTEATPAEKEGSKRWKEIDYNRL